MINKILKVNTEYSLAAHGGLAEPRAASDGTEPRGLVGFLVVCYQEFHEISYRRDLREFLREHESHSNTLAVQGNWVFLHVQRQPILLKG